MGKNRPSYEHPGTYGDLLEILLGTRHAVVVLKPFRGIAEDGTLHWRPGHQLGSLQVRPATPGPIDLEHTLAQILAASQYPPHLLESLLRENPVVDIYDALEQLGLADLAGDPKQEPRAGWLGMMSCKQFELFRTAFRAVREYPEAFCDPPRAGDAPLPSVSRYERAFRERLKNHQHQLTIIENALTRMRENLKEGLSLPLDTHAVEAGSPTAEYSRLVHAMDAFKSRVDDVLSERDQQIRGEFARNQLPDELKSIPLYRRARNGQPPDSMLVVHVAHHLLAAGLELPPLRELLADAEDASGLLDEAARKIPTVEHEPAAATAWLICAVLAFEPEDVEPNAFLRRGRKPRDAYKHWADVSRKYMKQNNIFKSIALTH